MITLDSDRFDGDGRVLSFYTDGAKVTDISLVVDGEWLIMNGHGYHIDSNLDRSRISSILDEHSLIVVIPFRTDIERFNVPVFDIASGKMYDDLQLAADKTEALRSNAHDD